MNAAASPPEEVIEAAIEAAKQSPCAKSKRGVAAFATIRGKLKIVGIGFNGPPPGFDCGPSISRDGRFRLVHTHECRDICNKWAVHAEVRAIRAAQSYLDSFSNVTPDREVNLLHVKVEFGRLSAGKGPSCWQCSRELVDAGFGGIWLYEATMTVGGIVERAGWFYYPAEEFHIVTWRNQNG